MTTKPRRTKFQGCTVQSFQAVLCVLLLALGNTAMYAQEAQLQGTPPEQAAAKIPSDQLDSLVAPIALYPDPLLSQVLVASTYPLEVIQLQQWLAQHKDLKDKALTDAVQAQDWDPSIQSMAVLPDAVKQMAENIKWTTDLGNAFLAQQSDVMDAVQRMRMKAKDAGNLVSNEQQQVETRVVETKTVVIIQQANPQMEDALMAFGLRKMQEYALVTGGDAKSQGILTMTDARWKQTFDFMASAGLTKPDLDYRQAYTLDFVKAVKVLP